MSLILLATAVAAALGCQESGFDERKETARPLKVQHALGESKVPGQAERPVTLTVSALDDTLALGVRPVRAALPGRRIPNYLSTRAAGIDVIEGAGALDLGAVAAAQPDLIVGEASGQARLYRRLSRIAPTVMSDGEGAQWKLDLRLHGEALGRTNDAEALLSDWDRRVGRLRSSRPAATEIAAVRVTPTGARLAGPASFAANVLADAGLVRPSAPAGDGKPRPLADLDADVILLSVAPGAASALRRLERSRAWPRVAGAIRRVDDGAWWSGGGVLAARAALGDLRRILHPRRD